jgi:1,4-alpha-glucan branching enzyme
LALEFAVHTKSPQNFNVASYSPLRRAAPERVAKPINFICSAPQAQSVVLVGDFNEWSPQSHPMKRMPDGAWMITVELKHGHHRYLFLVDSQPHLDPRGQGIARNDKNERVSLIAVS